MTTLLNKKSLMNRSKEEDKKEVEKNRPKKLSFLAPPTSQSASLTKKERNEILMETIKKETVLPNLTIVGSKITTYSWQDMQKIAGNIRVMEKGLSGTGTVNDPRMGEVSLMNPCENCSQIDCPGHYGLIEFHKQIPNPVLMKKVIQVLNSVCNDCGKLLANEDMLKQKGVLKYNGEKRLTEIEKISSGLRCIKEKPDTDGGQIVECGKKPVYKKKDIMKNEEGIIQYTMDGATHIMPIERVETIFKNITIEDAKLLGFSDGSHPSDMLMKGTLVPPIIARAPVYDDGKMYHDQLTLAYNGMINKMKPQTKAKSLAKKKAEKADKPKPDKDAPSVYSMLHHILMDNEQKPTAQNFLSIIKRIQGKDALLRQSLMGKTNDKCGRTVAGSDPTLKFGEIRLPRAWSQILTPKIKVSKLNMLNLTELKQQGKIKYITLKATGKRVYNSEKIKLRIGDVVERELMDKDRVVINRQPTLHRQSMMSYKVVLGNELTIGLHTSYTTPMNCDFDGDENNAWCPQDFEVQAECEFLLNVKRNIMSEEENKPIMGLVMNSITGAYLLSDTRTYVNDDLFEELLNMMSNKNSHPTLLYRLKKYGIHPRSGKALFSALLPEDFYYKKGNILIVEGVLLTGRLNKGAVGTSHRSIIQELHKMYGFSRTSDFFTDASWIINKWLMERGFTVGFKDILNYGVDENGNEYDKTEKILKEELAKVYAQLDSLSEKQDNPIEEIYRQRKINVVVNSAENIGLKLASEILSPDNSIAIMTEKGAGTKGAVANIAQMVGAVCQQFYGGERLKPTLSDGTRLMPYYDYNDQSADANGFISNSFTTGLNPKEFFFLMMGGREGLLDTALKTSKTGNLHHRLGKAMENIVTGYDGAIRNTSGNMFSTTYNMGYDIAEMCNVDYPDIPDVTSFIDLNSVVSMLNCKHGWIKSSIKIEQQNDNLYQNDQILSYTEPVQISYSPIDIDFDDIPEHDMHQYGITKYEKARIIGARATQLSNNIDPIIDIEDETDYVNIAAQEFNTGSLNIYAIRKFPNGDVEKIYPTIKNISLLS